MDNATISTKNNIYLSGIFLDKQNTINAMANGGLQLSDINHFNDGVISRLTDFDLPVKPRITVSHGKRKLF